MLSTSAKIIKRFRAPKEKHMSTWNMLFEGNQNGEDVVKWGKDDLLEVSDNLGKIVGISESDGTDDVRYLVSPLQPLGGERCCLLESVSFDFVGITKAELEEDLSITFQSEQHEQFLRKEEILRAVTEIFNAVTVNDANSGERESVDPKDYFTEGQPLWAGQNREK